MYKLFFHDKTLIVLRQLRGLVSSLSYVHITVAYLITVISKRARIYSA